MFSFSGDYAFMGSLIIKEVVNELLTIGLDKAKVLLLAGSRFVAQVLVFLPKGIDLLIPLSSHQRWRYRRPAECGPCCRAARVSGPPRGAGQGSGRLWMVLGQ